MPLTVVDGCEILVLRGTPEQMGEEQGRLLASRIAISIEKYFRNSVAIFDVPYTFLMEYAGASDVFLPERCRVEMKSLADAAGVSYAELLAFNLLVDLDACYMQQVFQCCNVVVSSSFGFFAHGRNLDFPIPAPINNDTAIVVFRIPSEKKYAPTLSVSWAGLVGIITGCNRVGLSVGAVSSPARDPTMRGIPLTLLMRDVLEQADGLDTAEAMTGAAKRTHGYNLAFADGRTRNAMGLECTPDLCERRGMESGFLIVDNLCMCGRTARMRVTHPAGVLRYARAVQLVSGRTESMCVESMLGILADRYDLSVGREREAAFEGCNSISNFLTTQSVLFLPGEERVLVSHKVRPPSDGPYHSISFSQIDKI